MEGLKRPRLAKTLVKKTNKRKLLNTYLNDSFCMITKIYIMYLLVIHEENLRILTWKIYSSKGCIITKLK